MSAQELNLGFVELLSEIRAAGRGASRSALAAISDRFFPSLVAAADEFGAAVLAEPARERVLHMALAEARAASLRHAEGIKVFPNGVVRGAPWPWRRPSVGRKQAWGWALAGVAVILVAGALYYSSIRRDQDLAGPPPKKGTSAPIPQQPSLKPEGQIVEKGPSIDVRSTPVPRSKKQETMVAVRQPKAGVFGAVMGEPLVFEPGSRKPKTAVPGMAVSMGSTVETGDADKLALKFNDGTTLQLGFNTRIVIPKALSTKDLPAAGTPSIPRPDQVSLEAGRLYASVVHLPESLTFQVRTPVATAEVLGTEFGLELIAPKMPSEKLKAVLQVKEGRVAFFNSFGRVEAGRLTESQAFEGQKPTEPRRLPTLRRFALRGQHGWSARTDALSSLSAINLAVYPSGDAGVRLATLPEGEVRIVHVGVGSVADKAGLKARDVVLSLNGERVANAETVQREIGLHPGTIIALEVLRGEERIQVTFEPQLYRKRLPELREPLRSSLYEATRLLLLGDSRGAETSLRQLAARTSHPAVLHNLGLLYETQDRLGPAIRCYAQAIAADPGTALYHFNMSRALQRIGNFERSLDEIACAVRLNPNWAIAWNALAGSYNYVDRFDKANSTVDEALARFPNSPDLWRTKGEILTLMGKTEEAIAFHKKALELCPECCDGWAALAEAYHDLADHDLAEDAFRRALELDPTDVHSLHNLGIVLLDQEKNDAAEVVYRREVQLAPDRAGGYRGLSLVFQRLGRHSESDAMSRRALAIEPTDPLNHYNLAVILRGERPKEAEALLRTAIDLDPTMVEALVELGGLLSNQGRLGEAISTLEEALRIDPNHAGAYRNIGVSLWKQDKVAKAEGAFRRAIALEPKDAVALSGLGAMLSNRGMLEEAEELLRKAVQADPKYVQALFNLGVTLERRGKPKDAEMALRKALELDPQHLDARSELGFVLALQGKRVEAERTYREVLAVNPRDAKALSNLSILLVDQGKWGEAEPLLRTAVKLDPRFVPALTLLGGLLVISERYEEAEAVLKRALDIDPKSLEGNRNLAILYTNQKQYDQAEVLFRNLTSLYPKYAVGWAYLGLDLCYRQGKREEGILCLKKAVALDPNDSWAATSLVWALIETEQDLDDALKLALHVVQQQPTDMNAVSNVGWAYYKLGNLQKAEEFLAKSLVGTDFGGDQVAAETWWALGMVYEKTGRREKAVDAQRKAISLDPALEKAKEALKRLIG